LYGKKPPFLIQHHEDSVDMGGYFIVNGIERLIRLLIVPRRNHPTAIIRPSFAKRGPTYTHFGVQMRSVRPDITSQTFTLHYCTDGMVTLRFSFRKQEYMVPVVLILKALKETNDKEIFEAILATSSSCTQEMDSFYTDRIELLLRGFKRYSLYSQEQCLAYLGSKFAVMMDSPEDSLETEVGEEFIKRVIAVHLSSFRDKFNILIFMIQKLYALVAGDCSPDNPDSPQHQEILLGGHLYMMILKEKLIDWVDSIKALIQMDLRKDNSKVNFHDVKYIQKVISKANADVGKKLEYFLATGNLISPTGLDLQQTSGYTIVAEKLNFLRYLAHFRSVHRGAFFAELKTTTVRKLLPEAWGFLCPVHTPDGSPCGLLNHLSHMCQIITNTVDTSQVPFVVASLGVGQNIAGVRGGLIQSEEDTDVDEDQLMSSTVSVQLDGKVIGWCQAKIAVQVANALRLLKVNGEMGIPKELEVGWVPPSRGGQYPGLYLFSSVARMMRPVQTLVNGKEELIGSFEQVNLILLMYNFPFFLFFYFFSLFFFFLLNLFC